MAIQIVRDKPGKRAPSYKRHRTELKSHQNDCGRNCEQYCQGISYACEPFIFSLRDSTFLFLHVIEERHEPEVHVQLLVTVEQSETGIVSNKVDF